MTALSQISSNIVGESPAISKLRAELRRVACVPGPKLVTGETGTGKELIARELHMASGRRGQFTVVNCAGLGSLADSELFGHERGAFTGADRTKKGLFEAAHGGTLFLDEVGELPAQIQAKLLRAIEAGEIRMVGSEHVRHVNVWVIAATNVQLSQAVAAGGFRRDLFQRLKGVWLRIPPLRERSGDIRLLARHFAQSLPPQPRLSETCFVTLESYPWPGNVRELANAIAYAVAVCGGPELRPEHLPDDIKISIGRPRSEPSSAILFPNELFPLWKVEKAYIAHAIELSGGNVSRTARVLKIDRKTLHAKLRKYELGIRASGANAAAKADAPRRED